MLEVWTTVISSWISVFKGCGKRYQLHPKMMVSKFGWKVFYWKVSTNSNFIWTISFRKYHYTNSAQQKKNSTPHPPISVSPSPSTLQVWPSWRSHKERKMSTSNSWNTNGSTGNLRTCMCSFLGCCEAPTLKNGGKMCLVFRDKEICLTNYIHIYVYIYIIYIYL